MLFIFLSIYIWIYTFSSSFSSSKGVVVFLGDDQIRELKWASAMRDGGGHEICCPHDGCPDAFTTLQFSHPRSEGVLEGVDQKSAFLAASGRFGGVERLVVWDIQNDWRPKVLAESSEKKVECLFICRPSCLLLSCA